MHDITILVASVLPQLPLVLVWLAGTVCAWVNWRRHPRPALLTFIAMVLFLIEPLIGMAMPYMPSQLDPTLGWNGRDLMLFGGIVRCAWSVVSAIGFVLLLLAVFAWRDAPPPVAPPDDWPENEYVKTSSRP
jgi:hypothetical protein